MTDLKPCPFCGGSSVGFKTAGLPDTAVGCNDCRAQFPYLDNRDQAIAAWNTRAQHFEPTGDVGELVGELTELRAFLDGSGKLDGLSFGDAKKIMGRQMLFWWRTSHLPAIDQAAARITADQARIAELEGEVGRLREAHNAIIDRAPERAAKWFGMSAKDISVYALGAKP